MARHPGSGGLLSRLPRTPHLPGVSSVTEFDQSFRRECSRSDRGRRTLALVVFELVDHAQMRALAGALRDRIRMSDLLGYVDADRLGLLLPDTDAAGAQALLSELVPRLGRLGVKCSHQLLVYPESWAKDHLSEYAAAEARAPRSGVEAPDDTSHGGGNGKGNGKGNGSGSSNGSSNGSGKGDARPAERRRPVVPSIPEENSEAERSEPARPRARRGLDLVRSTSSTPVRELPDYLVAPLPAWKRGLDVLVSGLLLLALSPLFAVVALAIKLTSKGPVIFRQARAGAGGAPFTFYKFRSMYLDAEARKAALSGSNEQDGPIFKMRNDPRMTPIGRLIRRSSIDELPQLWNVLKGDMTLVGPRPPTLDEVVYYEPWQRRRLALKGGLTCIWQVSGRSEVGFEDWVRMDLRYARIRNLRRDLGLLFRTPLAILTGRGAY